jgi:hypothetical protein
MTIDRELAMKLWRDIFGSEKWAQDCFGTWMYRDDYGDHEKTRNDRPGGTGKYYSYGWDIDHIRPQSNFARGENPDFLNNFEPMQYINNARKSDSINFEINGIKYQVIVCDICKAHGKNGYGIVRISDGRRVDWKGAQNKYYL